MAFPNIISVLSYRLPTFEIQLLASIPSLKHEFKMQFTYTILISATTLIGFVLARPAGGPADAWEDCPGGSYYICNSNGFQGCCSVNPCSFKTCPSSLPTTTPTSTSTSFWNGPGAIIPTPRLPVNETCAQGQYKIYQPKMYNYYPADPDFAEIPTDNIQLTQVHNGSLGRLQVAVYPSVPPSAKNCLLNWAVGNDSDTFVSSNPGIADITILHDPLPANITWNTMSNLWSEKIGEAEFDEWTSIERPNDHIVGGFNCSATASNGVLAFTMGINGTGDGDVYLTQNSNSGWYIEYEC